MSVRTSVDRSSVTGLIQLQSLSGATAELNISGYWLNTAAIQPVELILAELRKQSIQRVVMRSAELVDWDSRLPSYLLQILDYCDSQAIEAEVSELPAGAQSLLKLARAVPERAGARRSDRQTSTFEKIGVNVLAMLKDCQSLVRFVGEVVLALWALLSGRARFRTVDLFIFIQDVGPNGFPIVTLISLLVGLILAFVGALQLAMFGAQLYIADLVALGTVREMGPLMTAIIMSGRTGAAYAAQLGTMNVNSEIDALRTMGVSPLEFLVLPRMLALVLMMPLLTLYADVTGILGGAVVSVGSFDVSLIQYYHEIQKAVHLHDLMIGVFKSVVFAALIAIAGCMRGMECGRSASAVGDAATAAVVDSIVYIVIADSIITLICNQLKF